MRPHPVKIKSIKHITHDVLQIVTEKPQHCNFTPGQATGIYNSYIVAIEKSGHSMFLEETKKFNAELIKFALS